MENREARGREKAPVELAGAMNRAAQKYVAQAMADFFDCSNVSRRGGLKVAKRLLAQAKAFEALAASGRPSCDLDGELARMRQAGEMADAEAMMRPGRTNRSALASLAG